MTREEFDRILKDAVDSFWGYTKIKPTPENQYVMMQFIQHLRGRITNISPEQRKQEVEEAAKKGFQS